MTNEIKRFEIKVRATQYQPLSFEVWFSGVRVRTYASRSSAMAYIVRVGRYQDWKPEMTYRIVRLIKGDYRPTKKVIATGLTEAEAQEHCSRKDTHGEGWFDAYEEEQ